MIWLRRLFGWLDTPAAPAAPAAPPAPEAPTVDALTLERVRPLLDLIAKAESSGNYNAYYSNARNESTPALTSMTIAQVYDFQSQMLARGLPSTAVGRYQFIRRTLRQVVERHASLDAVFSPRLQDTFALALLRRRGLADYLTGELSLYGFALNLAKEWAGLPITTGPRKGYSYYHSDGLNKARLDPDELVQVLRQLKPDAPDA